MARTSLRTFSDAAACRPSHVVDNDYVVGDSWKGYIDVDLMVEGNAEVRNNAYPESTTEPFATVALKAEDVSASIYVSANPGSIEAATALRDALTRAIRFAKKHQEVE